MDMQSVVYRCNRVQVPGESPNMQVCELDRANPTKVVIVGSSPTICANTIDLSSNRLRHSSDKGENADRNRVDRPNDYYNGHL